MNGNIRNFFPGGNTPVGFYSYYDYILDQKSAERFICIKGGPGVGKSSFMKGIGEHFQNKGEPVDYFWCSSDPDSVDGVLLRSRAIAFIDGTSPHMIDPVTPGAVDSIIDLGNFWDEKKLKPQKEYIMQSNTRIKRWFKYAYSNLEAAHSLRETLEDIYRCAFLDGELYKTVHDIAEREFSARDISLSVGKCKKYFATAITPKGYISKITSLIKNYRKLYYVISPIGSNTSPVMEIMSNNAVRRGFLIEQYYCPMDPENKVEHLLIPELGLGFVTINDYHDMETWDVDGEVTVLDMHDYINWNSIEMYEKVIEITENNSNALIETAISYLKCAKKEHDILEGYYIPNMNFEKIDNLRDEWIAKIEQNKV